MPPTYRQTGVDLAGARERSGRGRGVTVLGFWGEADVGFASAHALGLDFTFTVTVSRASTRREEE